MSPSPEAQVVDVGGRRLRLTHLDKVLYPATGTTKAEVADYLVRVSGPLLAQLRDRPVTRIRWPHGTGDPQQFFEKNAPGGTPSWVRTARVRATGTDDEHVSARSRGTVVTFPLLDDVAALVWAANLSALELHTPQWRVGADGEPLPPDRLVVDLDPGEGAGLAQCAAVALAVRERLADDGLEARPVTSGGKGLQLYAPIAGDQPGPVVREYARRLAEGLAKDASRWVTATMTKSRRSGKVLVDWSQNHTAKTTITPYSLRGRARPTVAAPRRWDEIGDGLTQLELADVLTRLDAEGDLLAGAEGGPRLPEA